MGNQLTVTTTTLKAKAEELRALNSKFKSEVANLESQEATLNGMWEGEAKDVFHQNFSKDVIQMNNFYNAIEKYVQVLNNIAVEYERAEQNNVNIASTKKF